MERDPLLVEKERILSIPAYTPAQLAEMETPPKPFRILLYDLSTEIYSNNKEKGFWDTDPSILARKTLILSEVSEAVEAFRAGETDPTMEVNGKPEGELSELADVFIRSLDVGGRTIAGNEAARLAIDPNAFCIVCDINNMYIPVASDTNKILENYYHVYTVIFKSFAVSDWAMVSLAMAESRGYTIQQFFACVSRKIAFNKTRPVRHGKSC